MEKYSKKSVFKRAFSKFKKRRNYSYKPYNMNKRASIISCRCEVMDAIYCANIGSTPQFQQTSQSYFNFSTVLNSSQSFTGIANEFAFYKITGVRVDLTPCSSAAAQYSNFSYGAPPICVTPYPSDTSIGIGQGAFFNDNALIAYLGKNETVSKYTRYPDNYYQGALLGIGTWNKCDNFNTQSGQFSTTFPDGTTNSSGSTQYLFSVNLTIYVLMKERDR